VQITTAQTPATPPLVPVALTRRESEVLVELARGRSYQAMARALFVSENTVKTHVTSVYRKLGVYRRIDAISVARQHQLL
jgi:LuxR family maltose regulon positive regulatory protein